MRKTFFLLACCLALLSATVSRATAQGLPDTPENRRLQAQRYLQAAPPRAMLDDMANNVANTVPPAQRDQVRQMFTQIDADALSRALSESLVKHFTADELKALAEFYGSPVGKSAMSKFGAYMADVMPAVQAEVMKAQGRSGGGAPGAASPPPPPPTTR